VRIEIGEITLNKFDQNGALNTQKSTQRRFQHTVLVFDISMNKDTLATAISMFRPSVHLWTDRMANAKHLKQEGQFT